MRVGHVLAFVLLLLLAAGAIAQTPVFVTSTTTDGAFGGLVGGDLICNRRAINAGLGSGWIALLSATGVDAIDRLPPGAGPFVRAVDGTVIADDLADLADMTIDNPVLEDEFGNQQATQTWTGTMSFGLVADPERCQDWTSNAIEDVGRVGEPTLTNSLWIAEDPFRCDNQLALYCVNTGLGVTEVPATGGLGLMLLVGLLATAGALVLKLRS